jgi:hypothetical protein
MSIYYIIPFLFIGLVGSIVLLDRQRKKRIQAAMEELPGEDELTFITFKGFTLPMRHLDKKETWDHMTLQQKIAQVRKTKDWLRDGKVIAVYNDDNQVVYVTPEVWAKRNYRKAGKEYYNIEHANRKKK